MAWLVGLDEILKQSSSWMTYKRGMEYYREHRVKMLKFDPDEMNFRAIVEGSEVYEVFLHTDWDGCLHRVECTCPAFASMAGTCKHIVAALLQVKKEMKHSDWHPPKQDPHEKTLREIVGLFQPVTPAENRTAATPLQVEYLLELTPSWNRRIDRWLTLRLKTGPKRLYVVKNIRDFLSAFTEGKPLYFTKNFTYDPAVHLPDQKDRDMLRFLASLYKSEQTYQQMFHPWDPPAGQNERQLTIPPDQILPLLQHLPAGRFCLESDGDSYTELPVMEGESPVSFSLSREGEAYVLQPEEQGNHEGPVLLSEDGICFDSGRIYQLNPAQRENILPLYRRIRQLPEEKLYIPPDRMETFSSTVLPSLKKESQLTIQRDVSDRMVQYPLRTEIYLDYKRETEDDERLTARITHIYGGTTVDPLLREEPKNDGIVLLRDIEKEQQVMAVFEEVGFRFNGKELYLDDEVALFHFIYDQIPELEEMADLYTTPALRNLLFAPERRPVPHVEVDTSTDWLEVRFELPDADPEELGEMLQAMIERKRYYRLQNGAFVSLEPPGGESLRSLLEEGARRHQIKDGRLKLPAARALQLEELLEQHAPDIKLGQRFRRLIRNIKDPENLKFSPPATLEPILRDYQRFGFQWLKTLAHYRFGGILADDMGLGKTLQALTFILSELEEDSDGRTGPALVVAPASLIYNWEKECARFAPDIKALVIAGTRTEREQMLQDLTGFDLLITSYPLLRRDRELYDAHQFRTLILDEAQSFKNQHSQTAQAVRRISSRTRFALSGTPIENSLDELGSIMEVVMPGLFFGRQALRDLPTKEVARRVRPFILRRMKRDVLTELPEKIESVQLSELTPQQKRLYMATLQQLRQETQQALQTEGFQKNRMKILAGLTRLRQICCHPSLYLENYTADSGKFAQLLEKLDELLQNQRRALIFSQFTGMLALIRAELEGRGVTYHYLDGSTPAKERLEMAHRFNSGEKDLFLISLKAGGTGLNLTGADTVILYDLWWNPAVEQQAADRAHRIGQKKTVQVIRLITRGTIEEKIHELQQKKQALFDQVIQPGEQMLTRLSEADLREILNID